MVRRPPSSGYNTQSAIHSTYEGEWILILPAGRLHTLQKRRLWWIGLYKQCFNFLKLVHYTAWKRCIMPGDITHGLRRDAVELSCKLCPGDITNSVCIHHQLNSRGYATIRRPRRIHGRSTYDETMQRSKKNNLLRGARWSMAHYVIMVKRHHFWEDKLSYSR